MSEERSLTAPSSGQVKDFLQRVRSKRFPSIEGDMRMVLAHCGSLLLDPAAHCQARFRSAVIGSISCRHDACLPTPDPSYIDILIRNLFLMFISPTVLVVATLFLCSSSVAAQVQSRLLII